MDVEKIMQQLEQKHPGEFEYLQAVREVLISVKDVYNQHPEFEKAKIIERIVEPERIITFRVPWWMTRERYMSTSDTAYSLTAQ